MIKMIHLLLLRLYRSVRPRFAQDQVWGGGIELFRCETQKKKRFHVYRSVFSRHARSLLGDRRTAVRSAETGDSSALVVDEVAVPGFHRG